MVMFTCNHCSAGLKKNQVETHSFKCGGPSQINLSCHDCLKDFRGKAYESHTSCVTEEARYGGKDAVVKVAGKKQNQWREVVQDVLANNKSLDPAILKFLKPIAHFENIPRKRKPFMNWAQNVAKRSDIAFLDKVFDVLQAEFNKTRSEASPIKAPDQHANKANGGVPTTMDSSSPTEIGSSENPANGEVAENKMKKKKNKAKKKDDETQAGNSVTVDQPSQNGGEMRENGDVSKKKKKKKKSTDSLNEEPMDGIEEDSQVNGKSAEVAQPAAGKFLKLSKKERKLLKKKGKFDAEVAEIESSKKLEGGAEEEEVVVDKNVKKSKKRKNEVVEKAEEQESGAKKRKVDAAENVTKEPTEDPESPKKLKFKWHETILTVLRKSKHEEVPVKKVTKRVIDEYISQYGDKAIHEKLHAKMKKKLQTCPGVKVLKEKVKLLEGDR